MIPVHTLLVRPSPSSQSTTKSLQLLSTRSSDPDRLSSDAPPDIFELEISQPPTREDWVAGIREAVDASARGEGEEEEGGGGVAPVPIGLRLVDGMRVAPGENRVIILLFHTKLCYCPVR